MPRVTNESQLDNGTCGRNLQIGKPGFCPVSDPTVLLWGDGGASVYTATVDGKALPDTFTSDGYGNVCINMEGLADGDHVLQPTEIRPNPGKPCPAFHFTIDTHVPAAPSMPELVTWKDSAPVGDHITMFNNPTFTGTAEPGNNVQIFSGPTGVAGGLTDSAGSYLASANPLRDGAYQFVAKQISRSGIVSPPSEAYSLIIKQDTNAGVPSAPTLGTPKPFYYQLFWSPPTSDGGAAVSGYRIYRGDTLDTLELLVELGTATFFVDYTATPGKRYVYQVAAVNAQGEGPKSNVQQIN